MNLQENDFFPSIHSSLFDIPYITVDINDRFGLKIDFNNIDFGKDRNRIAKVEEILLSDAFYTFKSVSFENCRQISTGILRLKKILDDLGRTASLKKASISLSRALTKDDINQEIVSWICCFGNVNISSCGRGLTKFFSLLLTNISTTAVTDIIVDNSHVDDKGCDYLLKWINMPRCTLRLLSIRNCGLGKLDAVFKIPLLARLLQGIPTTTRLTSIDISQNIFLSASYLVESLNGGFFMEHLQKLYLEYIPIDSKIAKHLGHIVSSSMCQVKHLSLSNSKIGSESLQQFSNFFYPQTIGNDVAYSGFMKTKSSHIHQVVLNPYFSSLDISYCGLTEFDPLHILLCPNHAVNECNTDKISVSSVECNRFFGLKQLILEGNRPTSESWLRFVGACSNAEALTSLNVANCGINSVGAVALFARLGSCWQVRKNNLTSSTIDNDELSTGTCDILFPIPVATQSIASSQLIAKMRQQNKTKLSDLSQCLPPISELNISSNQFGFRAVHLLTEVLQKTPKHPLRVLHLTGNAIGTPSTNELLETIRQSDRRIIQLHLSSRYCTDESSLSIIAGIEQLLPIDESGTVPLKFDSKLALLLVLHKMRSNSSGLTDVAVTTSNTLNTSFADSTRPNVTGLHSSRDIYLPAETIVHIFSFLREPIRRKVFVN